MKQRAQHVINNEHLQKEVIWQAEVANITPRPEPKWWNRAKCTDFLNKHPINDPGDKAWLLQKEASVAEAIDAAENEKETLQLVQQEKASASKWTDMCPWLRLHMCMCDDQARAALGTLDDAWDCATLNARNNDDRPPDWFEIVAELYDDPNEVFMT